MQNKGFQTFIVGGAVRDKFLDRTPKDFDISTSAEPKQIIASIPYEAKVNLDYFVCDFKIEGIHFEITSFRDESKMVSRKDFPIYGNLRTDCQRRDFTVNSLYLNPINNKVIDPCKMGLSDIKNRIIRTVRDTDIVLKEDPIRIVRAISLQKRFGFSFDFDIKKYLNLVDFGSEEVKRILK